MTEAEQRHYRLLRRRGFPHVHALRLAHGRWIGIAVHGDTSFLANRDDGFGHDDNARKVAYANARKAGINPTGKIWCPGLARKGKGFGRDREAWITSKADVRKACEKNNRSCHGLVNVKSVETEPIQEPSRYEVADDLVEAEVNRIVREEQPDMTPTERVKVKEQTKTRLSGTQD